MIALNHVLTGTAIGLAVKNPLLVAPLAFLSHFVLDAMPHFDYRVKNLKFIAVWAIDAVLSALALLILCTLEPSLALAILVGGVAAELPDVFWIYERLVLRKHSAFWFFKFHRGIQWSETQRGFFYELVYLAILVTINAVLLLNL